MILRYETRQNEIYAIRADGSAKRLRSFPTIEDAERICKNWNAPLIREQQASEFSHFFNC
jgi:hypothetical protein